MQALLEPPSRACSAMFHHCGCFQYYTAIGASARAYTKFIYEVIASNIVVEVSPTEHKVDNSIRSQITDSEKVILTETVVNPQLLVELRLRLMER